MYIILFSMFVRSADQTNEGTIMEFHCGRFSTAADGSRCHAVRKSADGPAASGLQADNDCSLKTYNLQVYDTVRAILQSSSVASAPEK